VLIFKAREHIGHKDVAFGSSMTVSTPPSSRILQGHTTRVNVGLSDPSVEQKNICPEIVENKVFSLFVHDPGARSLLLTFRSAKLRKADAVPSVALERLEADSSNEGRDGESDRGRVFQGNG
jgi:hypothetical protein